MHLPGFARDTGGKGIMLSETEIEGDEIEGRAYPSDAGDHVTPAQEQIEPVIVQRPDPGHGIGDAKGYADDRQRPGDLRDGIADLMAYQKVPERHAAHDDKTGQNPSMRMVGHHREVVTHLHDQHRQRQIGVVQRTLLAGGAERRIRRLAADQSRRDLALGGNDHHEHIRRHNGADEHPDMDEGTAPRIDMGVTIGRDHDEDENQRGEKGWIADREGPAQRIIDDPTGREAQHRNCDRLPRRKRQDFGVDQEGAGVNVVLDDEQEEAGNPSQIGFPFEPDQILGKLFGCREIFSHMVETAAMDFPCFARDFRWQACVLLEREVECYEVK